MQAMKIDFNPGSILVTIDLWRKATDMQIPVHDEFKLHFIKNRGAILQNFERTSTSWMMLLRDMAPLPEDKAEFDQLIATVEEFKGWATSELKILETLALQESMVTAIEEGLRDPDLRTVLGKILAPYPKKDPGGK